MRRNFIAEDNLSLQKLRSNRVYFYKDRDGTCKTPPVDRVVADGICACPLRIAAGIANQDDAHFNQSFWYCYCGGTKFVGLTKVYSVSVYAAGRCAIACGNVRISTRVTGGDLSRHGATEEEGLRRRGQQTQQEDEPDHGVTPLRSNTRVPVDRMLTRANRLASR